MKLKAAAQGLWDDVASPITRFRAAAGEAQARASNKKSAWYHRDDASGDKKSRAFRFGREAARPVCLGDWVVIHSASMPDQSCVSIESKSNPTLLVKDYSPHKAKHEDFLFELVPRQKVNVDGLVELVKTSRSGPFDDRFLHSFENLKREQVHYEASWRRTPLTYGQTIQLKHVSTQRFLAVQELWSEYNVSLEGSNKNCWFSVRPLGQSRMGSMVKEGDMFLLVSLSCGAVLRQTSLHEKAKPNLLTLSFVPGRVFDLLHGWTMTVHASSNSRSMLRNGQQLRLYFNNTNAIGQWYQEGYIMGNLHQSGLEPDIGTPSPSRSP
ncbi:Inositol 1,4,5-trisphosphate receptor type 1 [Balamuthia mandrillaris]